MAWTAFLIPGVLLIWSMGILVGVVSMIRGRFVEAKLRASFEAPQDQRIPEAGAHAIEALGLDRKPKIFVSRIVPSPLSLGIFNPVIIFPKMLEHGLEADAIEGILLHETAHVAHRDHLVGLLQSLAQTLFWWNPAVYGLNNRLSEVREEICDNYVVKAQGDGKGFAQCLVDIAERTAVFHRLPTAVGLKHPRSGFERRVKGLLKNERNTMTQMNAAALMFSLLFMLGITGVMVGCAVASESGGKGSSTEKILPVKAAQTQNQAIELARTEDLPAIEQADRLVIRDLWPQARPSGPVTVTQAQLAIIRNALDLESFVPSGGEAKYQLDFYKGKNLLRQIWLYERGEWGIRRPKGPSWTLGLEPKLAQWAKAFRTKASASQSGKSQTIDPLKRDQPETKAAAQPALSWGPKTADDFRIRITPHGRSFEVGRPIKFRIEMQYLGVQPGTYSQTTVDMLASDDSFEILGPDGVRVPWLGGYPQVAGFSQRNSIQPKEILTVKESIDLCRHHFISTPGTHTVRLKSSEFQSNRVVLQVAKGRLPLQDQVIQKLLPILPRDRRSIPWHIVRRAPGQVVPNGWKKGKGEAVGVSRSYMSGEVIQVHLAAQELEKGKGNDGVPKAEYMGRCKFGFLYLSARKPALKSWPEARVRIAKALGIP